jgi:DNA-binding XRE family transcriptional regulator
LINIPDFLFLIHSNLLDLNWFGVYGVHHIGFLYFNATHLIIKKDKTMQKLREYLKKRHMKQKGFAQEVGISTATLHHLLKGNNLPSIATAIAIEEKTQKFISVYDWVKSKKADKDIKEQDQEGTKKQVT